MPKFVVTVNVTYQKEINVYASDEGEAEENACDIVREWNGVHDVEAESVEEE